jgi:hypothetical protein
MRWLTLLLVLVSVGQTEPVTRDLARAAVESRLKLDGNDLIRWIGAGTAVRDLETGAPLAWVFELEPAGYVITSADDILPPVIAYSYSNEAMVQGEERNPLLDLVRMDLGTRMDMLGDVPEEAAVLNQSAWAAAAGQSIRISGLDFQQWPPAGSTPTGGWLMANWTQSAPYNSLCPMDLIAGQRSVAGCPAVAMAMIVNFHQTTNSTRFNDGDDYYHNYHEYYWIDNDCVPHDFPSWAELNAYLDVLDTRYLNQEELTSTDKAALVYSCGAACRQVYTASVSGTFGVDQAYDAYIRFAFSDCELLFSTSDSLYDRMADNMMTARPAHLAIVDEEPQYGHNVVMDGYNTDEYYHLNFGWGGSYNAWYQFPLSGMPYGMNFIEGIVLDIGEGSESAEGDPFVPADRAITLGCTSNPSIGSAGFVLSVLDATRVSLAVYSLAGHLVYTMADGDFGPGTYEFQWDPRRAPAGVYIVRALHQAGTESVIFTLLD